MERVVREFKDEVHSLHEEVKKLRGDVLPASVFRTQVKIFVVAIILSLVITVLTTLAVTRYCFLTSEGHPTGCGVIPGYNNARTSQIERIRTTKDNLDRSMENQRRIEDVEREVFGEIQRPPLNSEPDNQKNLDFLGEK